jgi:hypothetical protein
MDLDTLRTESYKSTITNSGIEILSKNEKIYNILGKFCISSNLAESELRGEKYLGSGNHSAVWSIDDIALKISSHSTGKIAWKNPARSKPENLIRQLSFLELFKKYNDSSSDGYITVPEQYFAFRNIDGDYIKGEEDMIGWKQIKSVCDDQGIVEQDRTEIYESKKSEINNYLNKTYMKYGLTDLGLKSGAMLHGGNILLPENTRDISNSPVCIIDQPSRGIRGKIAETLIRHLY